MDGYGDLFYQSFKLKGKYISDGVCCLNEDEAALALAHGSEWLTSMEKEYKTNKQVEQLDIQSVTLSEFLSIYKIPLM